MLFDILRSGLINQVLMFIKKQDPEPKANIQKLSKARAEKMRFDGRVFPKASSILRFQNHWSEYHSIGECYQNLSKKYSDYATFKENM